MHIFAISGLHIALIAGVLVAIARTLQIPRGICGLLVIPLIWFYTAATGWQSSAIRSTIMMTIVISGWALKRPIDLINSLAGAALIILLWDPLQLFQASFQLSFFVVLSIALFMAPLKKWLAHLWQPDPFLPAELRPRWQRWLGRPLRWLVASFATSLAAWLGSLPLTAYYFHLFNPVSLLANLAVVPLSGLALMCGMGSLLCGDWLPRIGELFNHSAWFWMKTMVWFSEWAASLRFGWWYVAAPGLWFFAFYYTSLIAMLAGGFKRARLRPWLAALILLLCSAWALESWQARHQTSLVVLPLNGGHALFLDQPGHADDWLVDTGNSSACEFVTIPFLRAQGVNRLAHLALTQGDVRQMGGAAEILADFLPDDLVTSSMPARSPNYRKLTSDLAGSRQPWRKLNRGDATAPWLILHPDPSDHFAQADDNALVLAAQLEGVRVLLLSDLGRDGQESLLRREPDLHADIVIAGLPAKAEPLSDALLEALKPKLIVLADSEFPATRRAPRALRERLALRGVDVLYTRETGAVVLGFKNGGWKVTPMIPANANPPNKVNEQEAKSE
jgi:ComEC/Rec2-related protein